ncbi:MAG: IS66 family insertion sequence element accessory protein TnpB [Lachnospiraceae bacterium]|nr:IS66 family insertion sequence element accessory protein TnpB [Lachnospiraceae bacterium]
MRAKPTSTDEQYRLVLECRASGLSDYQWCMEHGIKPGTFYNWIKRLRQKECKDIPMANRGKGGNPVKQEVVKIDFPVTSATKEPEESFVIPAEYLSADHPVLQNTVPNQPVIEVALFGTTIRIPQGADSDFMERVFRTVKAVTC